MSLDPNPEWSTFSSFCKSLVNQFHALFNDSPKYHRLLSDVECLQSTESIIDLLLDYDEVNTFVDHQLQLWSKRDRSGHKSENEAQELLSSGQEFFQKKEYERSLYCFSDALCSAPLDSLLLTSAIVDRCNVFFLLNQFTECLKDIEVALSTPNFPKDRLFLLHVRRILCLQHLGRQQEAEAAASSAIDILKRTFGENSIFQSMKDLILDNLQKEITPVEENSREMKFKDIKTTVSSPSSTIDGASAKLTLNENDKVGRFVTSCQDIQPSEVVFQEEALTVWLEPRLSTFFCSHCLKFIQGQHFIPAKCCTNIRFCSQNCLQQASLDYHDMECPNMDILQNMSRVHIAIKILLKTGIEEALKIYDNRYTIRKQGHYRSDYSTFVTLTDHLKDVKGSLRIGFAITSLLAGKLIFPLGDPQKWKKIVSMIFHHSLQVWCNCISIEHDLRGGTKTLLTNCRAGASVIGVGIYPTISLLNHSCGKITYVIFRGRHLSLKSYGLIPCGQEVTFNYGPWDKKVSFKDRQDILARDFLFHCQCTSCSEKRENVGESFKCPFSCEGKVILSYSDSTSICLGCKTENVVTVDDVEKERDKIRPTLMTIANMIRKEKLQEAYDLLEEAVNDFSNVFHPSSNTMITMRENLANVCDKLSKNSRSLEVRMQCLEGVKEQRGEDNYYALYFMRKMVQSMIFDGLTSRGKELLDSSLVLERRLEGWEGKRLETPDEILDCLPTAESLLEKMVKAIELEEEIV